MTEILRTNPPAPFAMRLVREPLKLENVTVSLGDTDDGKPFGYLEDHPI